MQKIAFEIKFRFSQKITGIKNIHLSLSQYTPLEKKEVLGKEHTRAGRITPFEHLQKLLEEGRIRDTEKPLMVLSVRNVLSNLRCLAYIKGYTENGLARVAEEDIATQRLYHVLGRRENRLLNIEEFSTKDNDETDYLWFFSGTPVLWNDMSRKDLFEKIVTDASDHSHVWHIPRGNHPEATNRTREIWQDLQDIFIQTLTNGRDEAFSKLQTYAKANKLKREDKITHNIMGVDNEGNLHQLIANGYLEDLGDQIKALGAKRALCVDNSGSTAVQYYPDGINGECKQLAAAPNYRSPGTAFLVIELVNDVFKFF